MILINLNSDNFKDLLCTAEAYEEIVLQMSTGDFHTHKAYPIVMPVEAVEQRNDVAYITDWTRELMIPEECK